MDEVYTFSLTYFPDPPTSIVLLNSPNKTRALPAGPALFQAAKVIQNGSPASGKSVTVGITGGGSFSGVTDSAGELPFTYVPPASATSATITANCTGCSNTATKQIDVQASDAPNMCLAGDFGTLIGNPISPSTGEKIQTQLDWADSGAHPLSFSRHYKSYGFGVAQAGLGNYWSHNFAASISDTAADNSRTVRLGDGTSALFSRANSASAWVGNTSSDLLVTNATGPLFTRASDDSRWQFDAAGTLLSVTQRNGWATTLAYANGRITSATNAFGRALLFTYDGLGRLASVTTPDAKVLSYTLDSSARLTNVLYPDGKAKAYVYENPSLANALTGIVDETGQRFASFAYDAAGRAVSTTHAGGAQNFSVSLSSPANGAVGSLQAAPLPASSPLYKASAQVTTPLGGSQTLGFQGGDGQIRLQGSNQAFGGAQFAARAFDYPAAPSLPTLETDFLGIQTLFTWDTARRLPLATTRAANRPEAQTTSTQWHAKFRLPLLVSEPGRTTATTYDALGNKLTETVTDTATAQTRTWAWSYNPQGLVATSTDPRGSVSTFTYDAVGNQPGYKNALNQTTAFTYDAAGRMLAQADPNGLLTSYTYDPRGRVLGIAQSGSGITTETTTFTYTPSGQVASVAQPSGYAATYTYDAAQRLVGAADNRGNTISYVLDAMGNRLREEIKDSTGAIARLTTRTVNQLNRLATQSGAAGQTSQFAYDANAEAASSTDPLNQTTRQTLDGLRRATATTLPDNAVASQSWSQLNQIVSVADPKGVATQYSRNAFGEVMAEASADTGSTSFTRDAAGNIASKTDARGLVTTYTRDALGRATSITFGTGTPQAFTHQFGFDAVGNVSQFTDPSGTTSYTRNVLGQVLNKLQTVADSPTAPSSYNTAYLYHPGGQVAQITYPSGMKVFYRKNAVGQISQMDVQQPGSTTVLPFVTGLAYTGLGQPKAWAWSNGDSASRTFDADGRMTSNELASYGYDSAGRVTSITQHLRASRAVNGQRVFFTTPLTFTATYNNRDRITSFSRNGASRTYTYDANGNRLSAQSGQYLDLNLSGGQDATDPALAVQQTLSIAATSNRLAGFSQTQSQTTGGAAPVTTQASAQVNYSLDATGNLTGDGLRVFSYNAANRLSQTTVSDSDEGSKITYLHNTLGQRVFKSEPKVDHVAPQASVLGADFIAWLQSNFGWLFTMAQSNATLGQSYVYDDALGDVPMLLGEYGNGAANGVARKEYLWLPVQGQAMPIGVAISPATGPILFAVHADHLNTPRLVTRGVNNNHWQWPYSAFGEEKPVSHLVQHTPGITVPYLVDSATGLTLTTLDGSPSSLSIPDSIMNLRYPGQYFDSETGLSYNYFRSYQPNQGRYTQADPIGLDGGLNRFGYGGGNPLSYSDPLGLNPVGGAYAGAGIGSAFGPVGTVVGGVIGAGIGAAIGWNVIGPMFNDPVNPLDPSGSAGHDTGARESTRGKHEVGDSRRKRDRGGEVGDDQRDWPRKRPDGWKGPWPPKPKNVCE